MSPKKDTPNLGKYRGATITGTTAKLVKTGDGLSPSMKLDPKIYEIGTELTIAVRCVVTKHQTELADPEHPDEVTLVQVFAADSMAVIPDSLVAPELDELAARLQAAEDAKAGQSTLPGQDTRTGRPSLTTVPGTIDEALGLAK